MHLKVKFAAMASKEAGVKETVIKGSPNLDITLWMIEEQTGFPVRKKLGKSYAILINGKSVEKLKKEGTSLQENDTIMVVPYMGGG